VEPVAGFLFPEEKVTRFRRIRKFIYQKGDIGNSDSRKPRSCGGSGSASTALIWEAGTAEFKSKQSVVGVAVSQACTMFGGCVLHPFDMIEKKLK